MGGITSKFKRRPRPGKRAATPDTNNNRYSVQHMSQPTHAKFKIRKLNDGRPVRYNSGKGEQLDEKHGYDLDTIQQAVIGAKGQRYLNVPNEVYQEFQQDFQQDFQQRILTVLLCYLSHLGLLREFTGSDRLAYFLYEQSRHCHFKSGRFSEFYFGRIDFSRVEPFLRDIYQKIRDDTKQMYANIEDLSHAEHVQGTAQEKMYRWFVDNFEVRRNGYFITRKPNPRGNTRRKPTSFDQIFEFPYKYDIKDMNGDTPSHFQWNVCLDSVLKDEI